MASSSEPRLTSEPGSKYPPGPDGLPLLGHTLRLVREPFGFLDDLAEYGDIASYRLAGLPFCALLHPDYIEHVLVGEPERFRRWTGDEWNVLGEFAPEGLLLTEGDQWREQRILMQPVFTPDRLRTYTDVMSSYAARAVERWDDGETVAINQEMSRLTLRILARSLFDLDVSGSDDVVTRTAQTINQRADARNLTTFLPSWIPTPARRRSRRAMSALQATIDDLIEERRANPGAHDDLLALLLGAEDDEAGSLEEAEIRDTLVTFLFAGHETTSLALTYAIFSLATRPEPRERLDDELATVLDGDPVTPEVLPELPYTEQVIKETLRLYPPAYVLFREATSDAQIGGFEIPAGTKLSLPVYHLHRDPRWYDEPEAFRPERWTDTFEDSLPDYAYFPFGGGPRHCIGMRFAMLELQHVLPTIVQAAEFDLMSDFEIDFQPGVTLQPTDDIELRIRKRGG